MASAAKVIHGKQLQAESLGRLPSESEEERNLSWGIRTCERFISLELGHASSSLAIKTLSCCDDLSFDLGLLEHPYEAEACQESSNPAVFSHSPTADHFVREVQAARLYTDIARMVQKRDFSAVQPELSRADHQLQTFFRDITYQCGNTWGLYCGSIAFTIG
ncbi:MAG: hypothetical protein Q9201_005967 [Fulgogasparrea decipioides]